MDKPDKSRADWGNYWQGRTAGQSGEVFGGVGIESSEELSDHWTRCFAGAGDAVILDLACGAGSAIRHAAAAGCSRLMGLDISAEALQATRAKLPGLQGLVASADRLPLADDTVDLAVSQFGFEYADRTAAARDIGRVLRTGGRFCAIVHLKDGAIAQECAGHLAGLNVIASSRFIPVAKAVFSAVFAFESSPSDAARQALDAALKALTKAQEALMPQVQAGGIAAHLHGGAAQLFERRRNYLEQDIQTWLDQMSGEIAAYAGRMSGMLNAAIDPGEAQVLLELIAPGGETQCAPFPLGGRDAALKLTARTVA